MLNSESAFEVGVNGKTTINVATIAKLKFELLTISIDPNIYFRKPLKITANKM